MKKYLPYCLILCFALSASRVAADTIPDSSAVVTNSKLPAVLVSRGVMSFIGDVGYSHLNEPLFHQDGWQIAVQLSPKARLSPSLYYLHGTLSGNEKSVTRTVNFKTSFNCMGAQVSFNLVNKNKPKQLLVPYLSAGIEYISFDPKGDLKNSEGTYYYYWNDGSIRDIDESSPNASNAQLINRDYVYETDLREADLDGLGNYSVKSFGIPVGVGVKLNLSSRCALLLNSVVHFTFTDQLDNISSEGTGARQGDSKNDKFIFSSASFSFDLGAPRDTPQKKKYRNKDYKNIDYNSIAKEDTDKDGVPDLDDESQDTPPNVAVDSKGVPLDGDEDGVPDYRDKEMKSAKGALINEEGITMTDELIEEKFRQDSIAALPAVREYVRRIDDDLSTAKGIPDTFKPVDVDKNGIISAKEIADAIDEFLAGKSTYDTDQFYRLIDFYFSQ